MGGVNHLKSHLLETGSSAPDRALLGTDVSTGIIVFSHLRWSFVWQRPQQFLSRFAESQPVLFVEEPDFSLPEGEDPRLVLSKAQDNVTTATGAFPASMRGNARVGELMCQFTREAVREVNADGRFDNPLLWYYSPMEAGWSLDCFEGQAIVYDCMDELSQFKGAPAELIENERRLMEAADVVFTGGYELWMKKSKQHDNCHFFGCGVEYEHFSQAQEAAKPIPEDVKNVEGPIIGWFGVVDERMDYDLLRKAAELRPDWSFVIVGPVVKVDPASLPQAENLHWLGGRDYKVLPDYCRAFDVCMMPFALNEATEYINPTKALEYLATGRPVVSTPVRDVVRQYSDSIFIAKSAEDFVACCEKALHHPDAHMIAKGMERAREAGWERTVEKMQELIVEAASRNAPPGVSML
jgi:glycosyltransferase involved in cell wall biosynthesis